MIPYFFAFQWLDDKRKLYLKDETMYPDLPSPLEIATDNKNHHSTSAISGKAFDNQKESTNDHGMEFPKDKVEENDNAQ